MKKIPTLFERVFEDGKIVGVTNQIYPGMEWVLLGEGTATVKMDGSCCAVIGGVLYKRYDAKKGKNPPAGAIPCCEPDRITGHWLHWVKCDKDNKADKWFMEAFEHVLCQMAPMKRLESILMETRTTILPTRLFRMGKM